jgi:hypothetical protein
MNKNPLTVVGRLFPDQFLDETNTTISLLFPQTTAAIESEKRNTRISEKHLVDIELALPAERPRELAKYPFWQERLGALQLAYNDSRPKRLKEWYFDRRNRNEWATFWIAVIVFFLTVFFGVISSITGIIQVILAYKALTS